MSNSTKLFRLLSNPQISSALIWAITILLCSSVSDKTSISTILITAAGFHVVLMTRFTKTAPSCVIE